MKLRFRATGRDAQHLSYLFVREPFDIVEDEDAARPWRKHGNRRFEIDREPRITDRRAVRIEYVIEVLHFFHAIHSATVGLSLVQNHIDRKPVKPRPKGALSAKLSKLVPDADEYILRELFGPRTVVDHARADRKNPVDVCPIESLEGTTISGRSQRNLGVLPVKHLRIGFRAPDWHLYHFDHGGPCQGLN